MGIKRFFLTTAIFLCAAISLSLMDPQESSAAQTGAMESAKDVLPNTAITPEQRTQLQAVLKTHETTLASLTSSYSKEKDTLAQLINAEPLDETAIRTQFAKAAKIGAEITVVNARLRKQLRAVLTTEQHAGIAKLNLDASETNLDRMLLRLALPVGNR